MVDGSGRVENVIGQVGRTLESEIATLKHRAGEANGIALEDGLSQDDRQGAPWLASGGCGEIRSRELGYMSCVMTCGNLRELPGI